MVDHTYRCIFIHQRKTAGTSIMSTFGLTPAAPNWHRYNGGTGGADWAGLQPPVSEYLVFSCIRNPFDRVISGWKYLNALRTRELEEVLRNLPQTGHDYRHITRPQVAILRPPGKHHLVTDYLIRFESLQADFDRLCLKLGKPLQALPRLRTSDRDRDYRKYYTPTTRALVESLFKDDLEAFDYSF